MKRFFATDQMLSELKNNDTRCEKMLDTIAYLINLNYLNILGDRIVTPTTICSTPGRSIRGKDVKDSDGYVRTVRDKVIYFSFDQSSEKGLADLYIFGTITIGFDGVTSVSINFDSKQSELTITEYVCDNVYRYFDEQGNEVVEEKVVLFDRKYNPDQYCMLKQVNGEKVYEGKLQNVNTSLSDNTAAFTFESEDNLKPVSLVRSILTGNIVQAKKYENSGIDTTESIFVRLKEEIENRIEARKRSEYKKERKFAKKNASQK